MLTIKGLRLAAQEALAAAAKAGATQAAAQLTNSRRYTMSTKNGAVELLKESQTVMVDLRLYVDHRFGAFQSSDISPARMRPFVERAVEMTRLTDPDPAQGLPDKTWTAPLPAIDLELCDQALVVSQKQRSQPLCHVITAAARGVSPDVIHVAASYRETHQRAVLLSSEGFDGAEEATSLDLSCETHVKDQTRKHEASDSRSWRHWSDVHAIEEIGRTAAERALAMKGSAPLKTGEYPVVIVNLWGDYVVNMILRALDGSAVYRRMSCLGDKLDQPIASKLLTLTDEPLLKRSLAAQHFDKEGMVARRLPLLEQGVLRNFYFDSYWARKQKVPPTTGSCTNITFALGQRIGEEMVRALSPGLFITSFLGGNFNPTSGDFSAGIRGFLVDRGQRVKPVSEMNLAGNLLTLLLALEEVGSDPYPYAPIRSPALRFGALKISGT